jgi:hypothetical protein
MQALACEIAWAIVKEDADWPTASPNKVRHPTPPSCLTRGLVFYSPKSLLSSFLYPHQPVAIVVVNDMAFHKWLDRYRYRTKEGGPLASLRFHQEFEAVMKEG